MTTFPGSPRLLKGAIVGVDPFNPLASVIVFQYNPHTLTRTLRAQTAGGGGVEGARGEALRLKGPPQETIKLNVEIDAADQLKQSRFPVTTPGLYPALAATLCALPRPLFQRVAYRASEPIDLIVTNVPGVPVPRYVAGGEIAEAYPFAPVAPHCPVSIALYGYRERLFVGLDADATSMPDVGTLRGLLEESFAALTEAAGAGA